MIINLVIIIKKSASVIIYNKDTIKIYIVIINLIIIIKKSASFIIYNKDTIKISIL